MRTLTAVALAAAVIVGCGGASAPDDVVEDFTSAYASGDFGRACDLQDADGSGRMTEALVAAAYGKPSMEGQLDEMIADVEAGANECEAMLARVRDWDLDPARVEDVEIEDVDEDEETATVQSSLGEWTLHEVDGEWRLSNMDAILPAELSAADPR